jgi:hypothetical protein
MGTFESKSQNSSEEFKKEYFKMVQKEINEGIKIVNSTINNYDETKSEETENWLAFLKEKLNEYLRKNYTENKFNYIEEILKYLDHYQDCNETIYQYTLKVFLAKSIDDLQQPSTNTTRSKCKM